jgi:hypothetical protein
MIKVAPTQLKRLVRDLEYSGGLGVCRTQAKNKDVLARSWFSVERFHGSGEP